MSYDVLDFVRRAQNQNPCETCGDWDEGRCAQCDEAACERHKIDGLCETCLIAKGHTADGCFGCGKTILNRYGLCDACKQEGVKVPIRSDEAAA